MEIPPTKSLNLNVQVIKRETWPALNGNVISLFIVPAELITIIAAATIHQAQFARHHTEMFTYIQPSQSACVQDSVGPILQLRKAWSHG